MRGARTSIILITATFAVPASAAATHKTFASGQDYLKLSEIEQLNYVSGAYDSISESLGQIPNNWLFSCTRDWSLGQVTAVLTKWLKEHPERWHRPAAAELKLAIGSVCPSAK